MYLLIVLDNLFHNRLTLLMHYAALLTNSINNYVILLLLVSATYMLQLVQAMVICPLLFFTLFNTSHQQFTLLWIKIFSWQRFDLQGHQVICGTWCNFDFSTGEVLSIAFHPGGGITTRNKVMFLFVEMVSLGSMCMIAKLTLILKYLDIEYSSSTPWIVVFYFCLIRQDLPRMLTWWWTVH